MRAFLQLALLAPVLVSSFAIPPSSDNEVKDGWTDETPQSSSGIVGSILALIKLADVRSAVASPVIVHVEASKGVAIASGQNAMECGFPDSEDAHGSTADDDLVELEYLQAQLEELKYLIHEKKRAIAER